VPLTGLRWYDDPVALAADPNLDVVVELIGGSEGPARALVEAALRARRPVVTANKALLAVHGAAIAELAEAEGVPLAFEASVAGGIPAIKAIREGLAANRILRVAGILNGTCNYILTTMREHRREFAEVLAEAQRLGYAEADPSFDIDGVDAAHKLAILAALAFGRPVDFGAVHVEGIREVTALDIALAEELGYRIKLLGIARREDEVGISTRVHPCMVPATAPIARVDGVFNAVVAEGDFVGRVVLEGRGAGAGPTASAVVADLIDMAVGRAQRTFQTLRLWSGNGSDIGLRPSGTVRSRFYLRLLVRDQPGVLAEVARELAQHHISISSVIQHEALDEQEGDTVPLVIMTHTALMGDFRAALAEIDRLGCVTAPSVYYPVAD
jgi:homoserine dehydrogenase